MHKLTLAFRQPSDTPAFEARWSQEFVPLAEQMPGIRKVTVSREVERLAGEADLYLVHEFIFDDLAAVRAAMASPQGQATGRMLMAIAGESVSLFLAEHLEEDRRA